MRITFNPNANVVGSLPRGIVSEPTKRSSHGDPSCPINATYTVLDADGNPLAKLHKNYLYNFFRKRWYVYALDMSLQFMAMEAQPHAHATVG